MVMHLAKLTQFYTKLNLTPGACSPQTDMNVQESYKSLVIALNEGAEAAMMWFYKNCQPDATQELADLLWAYLQNLKSAPRLKEFIPGKSFTNSKGEVLWIVKEKPGQIPEKMKLQTSDNSSGGFQKPDVLLRLGVFGGSFIIPMIYEVPAEWVLIIAANGKLSATPRADINNFRVISKQDHVNTEKNESASNDDLGWFQWYIRYYLGRRTDEDADQIDRAIHFINRHVGQIYANISQSRQGQRQACLQWGYLVPDTKTRSTYCKLPPASPTKNLSA